MIQNYTHANEDGSAVAPGTEEYFRASVTLESIAGELRRHVWQARLLVSGCRSRMAWLQFNAGPPVLSLFWD